MDDDKPQLYDQGGKIRRAVLGHAQVHASLKNRKEFNEEFPDRISVMPAGKSGRVPAFPGRT
jgi:hypothetical protein